MLNLGLAGPAGSGKDTIADYLISRYGFIKYSFSDALYREVAQAFGLEDESLLRNRDSKEKMLACLRLGYCKDEAFIRLVAGAGLLDGCGVHATLVPISPRQILQWWGTQYRRAQDHLYWIRRAHDWIDAMRSSAAYPEQRPQYFVNTSVRFENERAFINTGAWDGNVWHLHRDGIQPVHAHESETPLPVLPGEREIFNYADLGHLHAAVDQLLSTDAPYVRCEPALPMVAPKEQF